MIYTEMTVKAMRFCYKAHDGQYDKGGAPYVFHPFHVAEQMDDEVSTVVALLHDVLEDTPVTAGELLAEGFPGSVVRVVEVLTRAPEESYMAYIDRVKKDPVAKKVKLADLAHNSDESRVCVVDEHMRSLWQKYAKAKKRLLEA